MSFVYAGRGIAAGAKGRNFRVMLLATVIVLGLLWWLQLPAIDCAVLIMCLGVVLSLELLNTAGEMLIDVLSPGFDERYGKVKDVLAGAVLVAAIASAVVGAIVIGPALLDRI